MKFLYGRYGIDILSVFLLFVSSLLNLTRYTYYFGLALLLLIIFRAFSRNKSKRIEENNKFITFVNKFLKRFNKQLPYNVPAINFDSIPYIKQAYSIYKAQKNMRKAQKAREKEANKNFKIVSCPKCGQKLKLPKGKNKIIVTCKRCGHEFKMKT
ncbi:hypothetical protein [uncultured Clostridium sp.]|uniref:hypothetical protein n=1 Tax=uncultured Clostridium sp. TaxID=59620 RepID=UPI002621C354|nr:hypothetical protein [uncultured Clostridium sp.]